MAKYSYPKNQQTTLGEGRIAATILRFDVMSPIDILSYELSFGNKAVVITITFEQSSDNNVAAMKLKYCGYNAFGDGVTQANNAIILQELKTAFTPRQFAATITMDNNDIRDIDFSIEQVKYANGEVVQIKEHMFVPRATDCLDDETQQVMKAVFPTAAYYPKQENEYWQCCCGWANVNSDVVCNKCGTNKEKLFAAFTEEGIEALKIEHQKQLAIQKKVDKKKQKKNTIVGIIALVAVLIVGLGVASLVHKQQVQSVYDEAQKLYSKKEYVEAGKKLDTIAIDVFGIGNEDLFKEIETAAFIARPYESYERYMERPEPTTYAGRTISRPMPNFEWAVQELFLGLMYCEMAEREAVPSGEKEIIETFRSKYYQELKNTFSLSKVEVDKIIAIENYDTKKAKYEEIAEAAKDRQQVLDDAKDTQESIERNPFQFSNVRFNSNSSYTILEGSVKNIGSKTVKFVEVKVSFKDASGNVIDTDWTYAVGSEGLAPGESSKWSVSVTKDSRITDASYRVIDFD